MNLSQLKETETRLTVRKILTKNDLVASHCYQMTYYMTVSHVFCLLPLSTGGCLSRTESGVQCFDLRLDHARIGRPVPTHLELSECRSFLRSSPRALFQSTVVSGGLRGQTSRGVFLGTTVRVIERRDPSRLLSWEPICCSQVRGVGFCLRFPQVLLCPMCICHHLVTIEYDTLRHAKTHFLDQP